MKAPVVVDQGVHVKGRGVFAAAEGSIAWTVCGDGEEAVTAAVRSSGARAALVGSARFRGPLYAALAANGGGKPTLIARYGVGYDGVDAEQCRVHGVLVTNTPGTLDRSVAEHAMALLLALARKVPTFDRQTRAGQWAPVTTFELGGKALGIAGFGKIGKRTALIAAAGFGMKIHAFDSVPLEAQASAEGTSVAALRGRYCLESYDTDFASFARRARIVSIHMPVNAGTRGFFSRERLALFESGTLLVNTGRGALMDEAALYDALRSGALGGAALDVFVEEPYRPVGSEHDLRSLENVVLTPHVASNTVEANANMATSAVANVKAFLAGSFEALNRVI